MLGGGKFTIQNKGLPGTYINFVSAVGNTIALSERGIAAVPMILDWGPEKQVFEVTAEEFRERGKELFGYPNDAAEVWQLRELFKNLKKGIFYRLNGGIKAACEYAEARCSGIRGNALSLAISENVDDVAKFDVQTVFAQRVIDKQTVANADELADNPYVVFKKDTVLKATAGLPLTGGTNGEEITAEDYAQFLAKIEPYTFQTLCCPAVDDAVKSVFAEYTKRMRDEAGVKFQTVLYRKADTDYEGVISVENKAAEQEQGLVYWVAGAQAACGINKSNENKAYNGELSIDVDYTQAQLSNAVREGAYIFHKAGDRICVLMDLNTLVTFGQEKKEDFSFNQTVRVLDQIGNDIAGLFNTRYLGTMPNDEAGRVSLWNDIVTYLKQLYAMRAIEAVKAEDVLVEKGQTKRSVAVSLPVVPINCMSQLYMTVVVS